MAIQVRSVPIVWHADLSIYASEPFLKSVGSEYGWLGGFDDTGKQLCILPYTIVRKAILRMVRFRVETIPLVEDFSIAEEKAFLNSAMAYFRSIGADLVIPATTNTIFRTYPDRALAAPYGTYIVDLTESEETLWGKVHPKHRNVIRNAQKKGVIVREDPTQLEAAFDLIKETQARSKLSFMPLNDFRRAVEVLGRQVKVLVAEYQGVIHGCAVIPYSDHRAYYLYGGSIPGPLSGSMNFLQWEAMRLFKTAGVKSYDFVGVRINPDRESKQYGLLMFKERFGGRLVRGYMWKYPIRPLKSYLYNLAARVRRGGDIVDHERHKLTNDSPSEAAPTLASKE
jgi:lipid II:glycine glycyltransferase (peptidoglycan interpeptide bridge formation enzyme)